MKRKPKWTQLQSLRQKKNMSQFAWHTAGFRRCAKKNTKKMDFLHKLMNRRA